MAGKESIHDLIASAERRVAEANSVVERQKFLIARLRAGGADTEDAERTLYALVQTLTNLERHLRSLSKPIQ